MKLGVKHCRICHKMLKSCNKSLLCSYHYRVNFMQKRRIRMSNTNYVKGRRKEYKVVHQERDKECISFRSAGSHSPIDVVSINKETRSIRLIQCKPDSMSDNAKLKLLNEHKELNGLYVVSFEVV